LPAALNKLNGKGTTGDWGRWIKFGAGNCSYHTTALI